MTDEKTLAAYLHRISVPRPAAVDAATLRTLHRALGADVTRVAMLAAYRDHFGIILDRVPAVAAVSAGPA